MMEKPTGLCAYSIPGRNTDQVLGFSGSRVLGFGSSKSSRSVFVAHFLDWRRRIEKLCRPLQVFGPDEEPDSAKQVPV